jgi:hypothetical protein
MIIKCTLSIRLKSIGVYGEILSMLAPLPGYIIRRGPFIHDGVGEDDRIITIYEFDKSRLAEAWEIISDELDLFRGIPGFNFSAHRSIVFSEAKNRGGKKLRNRNFN